jgi:hypothetical protein
VFSSLSSSVESSSSFFATCAKTAQGLLWIVHSKQLCTAGSYRMRREAEKQRQVSSQSERGQGVVNRFFLDNLIRPQLNDPPSSSGTDPADSLAR